VNCNIKVERMVHMSEQIRLIAERLKGLREIENISPETLAKELNIPIATYLDYESGNADIPVSFLYEVSARFKIELSAILTGENPRLHTYALVRKGKGVSVERRKEYKYQSLAYNFVHKKAEPFLVTVEPDPCNTPMHYNSHPGQEFNYLLEGSLKVVVDNHTIDLNEGDSLFFDSNCKHGMIALNGKHAKFLAIIL
jgi:transcriptional regulator with XRE-family HTH domain